MAVTLSAPMASAETLSRAKRALFLLGTAVADVIFIAASLLWCTRALSWPRTDVYREPRVNVHDNLENYSNYPAGVTAQASPDQHFALLAKNPESW
jgi:hypothetical protein